MEGVVTRAVDKRGGNGKLLNILRVNNDVFCNLAALIQSMILRKHYRRVFEIGRFPIERSHRYHVGFCYRPVLMVSNTNRDSLRRWDMYARRKSHLHITRLSL